MDVFLSHTSALEALRRWGLRGRLAKGERCDVAVPPSARGVRELVVPGSVLESFAGPINVLVSNKDGITRVPGVRAHLLSGPLPEGSAVRVAEGVCCAAPELLAVQMAPLLTPTGLACLLSELMGLYAVSPTSDDGMFQREEPLTTPEKIRAYLGKFGVRPGSRLVLKALGHAFVRSGSPRETQLAMRLALRPGLGGYHLNVLSMNEPMEISRIHDRMSKGVRKPDILVASPDGTHICAFEYLGKRHNDPKRLVEDANRSNELKAMGISEYQIRKEQYDDLDYMDGLVEIVRAELGYPRVGMTSATAKKRKDRRRELVKELRLLDDNYLPKDPDELDESDEPQGGVAGDEQVPLEAYDLW